MQQQLPNTFKNINTNDILAVLPSDSKGYNVWIGADNYCLGKYNRSKIEQ